MNGRVEKIDVSEARKLAEEDARLNLQHFIVGEIASVLSDRYLEAENCWMFFKNDSIVVPAQSSLKGDWAYAVSKHGQVRNIADFSDDPEKLQAYLETMSDYFKRTEG